MLNKYVSRMKTNLSKVEAVVNLYNTILSGYSQCHSTGNKKKASGGWYHESCVHGTIVSSKFLFLGESVRDPVDLKLSSKYIAPTSCLGKLLPTL